MSEQEKNQSDKEQQAPSHFIREIIVKDLEAGKNHGRVATRFPPEPNGYLHIGHAKSICLNFSMAAEFSGTCNLRFDDTNPVKEEMEYVASIQEDVRWLGFDWGERLCFTSDYFEQLHQYAVQLISKGKAYVESLSAEEIREHRGSLKEPGQNSPYRDRSVEENLELFEGMRAGEFPDGAHVLRAKIDMAHPNPVLRDPTLYRIRKVSHHRTGDAWAIYPMYDFAHCLSDAIEGITHSLCTLEFENNRPLYEWVLEQVEIPEPPRQIEFARLNLGYTVLSKRKLIQLVEEGCVTGWDDPRLPSLSGLRRRGVPPEAIRNFCDRVGVARGDSVVDIAQLEHAVREELNRTAPRVMAVLRPIKLVIENYPEDQVDEFEFPNLPPEHPESESCGMRKVPFSRVLYIERDDFREEAPNKFRRLMPGKEVRLRYAYYVTCTGFEKNDAGEVTEVRCTYDPASRGGGTEDGRKVKGTLHWVSAAHAIKAEVRLYDRLFSVENPGAQEDFKASLNPDSLEVRTECYLEPSLKELEPGARVQFERMGYFCADSKDFRSDAPVFNRTATLRDSWARIEKAGKG